MVLPRGTVTFLFTDIEGSTALWEQDRIAMQRAVARQLAILRSTTGAHHGVLYKVIGDGTQAAFATAEDGLLTAFDAQRALLAEAWPDPPGPPRVRMALHVGQAEPQDGDYLAPALNRLARLLASAHGGQILLTGTAQQLTRGALPPDVALRDLGEHRLRDLLEPERVFQLLHPQLPDQFPPLKTLTARPHNLPLQPTTFVGREEQVERCVSLLRDPDVRLLTLTGPGGVGKTRLALQIAAELSDDYGDGVFFVGLSSLRRPDLVLATIADVLGIRESGTAQTDTLLRESIGARSILLLLDNFEHLAAAAPAVVRLLDCPRLKLLVTSRSRLRVRAEREVPVAPLPVPVGHDVTLTELSGAASVKIFVDRAMAVSPDFTLTAGNAPVVAEICRRLDGLPLAIELAAARVQLFPPEALLARLGRRLPLLTGGARDAPARQQTLRDTIDWSFDLLDAEQQMLFVQLSVFAGGCGLPAIEALLGAQATGVPANLVDALDVLVQHHLVRQLAVVGEPRFTMLETIREFGAEQLAASGDTAVVSDRHSEIYCDLAERAEPFLLDGTDEAHWLRELDIEHDNLRAALSWSLVHDALTATRLAGALTRFWAARGHLTEGADWLTRAVVVAPPEDPGLAAKVLRGSGQIAWYQGDYDRSVSLLERSLALCRATNDPTQIAWAESALADAVAESGDEDRAFRLYQEALQRFRSQNVEQGVSIVLNNLGIDAQRRGELEQAAALYEEALAISRRLRDTTSISVALGNLGDIALEQGRIDEAANRFRESLQLASELNDAITTLQGLVGLGRVAVRAGDYARGARLLAAAEAHSKSVGAPLQPGERAGFEAAVLAAMAALGDEGRRIWEAGQGAEFQAIVVAELLAQQGGSSRT